MPLSVILPEMRLPYVVLRYPSSGNQSIITDGIGLGYLLAEAAPTDNAFNT
jgi:hypothetical protein